jgi:dihydrofolate synthase/folylpolyglutamate synthase
MNYKETLDFMFSQLPMFQRIGKAAYKADLNNTIALLNAIEHPENSFKSIHIAGTNGKGSTSHMLASVFQEAGYKTGLYTSPHLIDFRERIKINGIEIPEKDVVSFIAGSSEEIKVIKPSFFELTVAMAFYYFRKEKVDIAIIETGLGGRLDSTNVIHPEISIITNIGMDHMQFLGNDLISIAKEKAGIIKKETPVIIGQATSELRKVFSSVANDKNAEIYYAEDISTSSYECDLKGNYQRFNIKTTLVALDIIRKLNWHISEEAIRMGLLHVKKNTGLSGRWEILSKAPKVICDTGHNAEGLAEVISQLEKEKFDQLHIVLGMVNDKDVSDILRLFPNSAEYYFCQASIPRSLDVEQLYKEAVKFNLKGLSYKKVKDAYLSALSKAKENDLIFVGGSTFIVADLLSYLKSIQQQ